MSYMSNAEFAPLAGIQELRMEDIDNVAGGPGPLAIVGGIIVFGFLAGAATHLVLHYLEQQ